MPSLIAWLDASADEQRRMREIIRLFSDRESRDELGIGQIRDAIGDGLFPGTSTLLTRARYLLFVPWCLRMAAQKPDPQKEADRYERALIGAIKATDDYAGLLGMRAGIALKNLPSVIYWTMLRHYGILVDPTMSRADALRLPQLARTVDDIEGDSATRFHVWSPSIPDPTAGFPWEAEGGFALTAPEAGWLRERILDGAPNTLMSHLLAEAPASDSPAPWLDEAALSVPGSACGLLDHARAFSAVLHGAQLLYNLLIAEEYEDAGFDRLAYPVAGYRERLDQWSASLPAHVDIDTWDLDELIRLVELQRGSPINYGTRQFVEQWTRIVRARSTTNLADDTDARACVARRERQHKGAQARIGNRARLAGWGGESGAGALVYRWPQVRGVLTDIHEGLAR